MIRFILCAFIGIGVMQAHAGVRPVGPTSVWETAPHPEFGKIKVQFYKGERPTVIVDPNHCYDRPASDIKVCSNLPTLRFNQVRTRHFRSESSEEFYFYNLPFELILKRHLDWSSAKVKIRYYDDLDWIDSEIKLTYPE